MSTDSVTREELHHRQVDLRFFRRSDALYEVEGRLIDTKTHPFRRMLAEKETPPGQHLHDITVRLVLDSGLLVHAADAVMPATPFSICPGAARTLAPLVGLSIGAGWNKRVRELLRGAASCTHIVELLGPMATTAIQGLAPQQAATIGDPGKDVQRRAWVDSCYAFAADREVAVRLMQLPKITKRGAP
ncbi:DUF2889 domain-containing protein [Variovorax guangxiensis]|uniref:DUF2889 domain-containing protein n=1 Tax=Variovorax guangxiensis TaxID=1775474 RepID=UPI002859CDC9|nr:DUF2889 domain-containing protein [Variovorax guangxiensis]MDR6858595.1 hypothetical protein [Variovorax guangxiensis]